jgi:carbon-monoxide dehydrogenase large subunit
MSVNLGRPLKQITGASTYVDDITLPGMLYAGFVRSPYAHARIRRISFDKVDKSKLVYSLTGAQLSKIIKPLPTYLYSPGERQVPQWNCLAIDDVNFEGEAVVAVVTSDRYSVEDLIDDVEVDYEPTRQVMNVESAIRQDAELVHDNLRNNIAVSLRVAGGDFDQTAKNADFMIRRKFRMHRHATAAIEPRGVIASYEPVSKRLTVWVSTQLPFILRTHLAQLIGIPENHIRVIAPDVGGAFGAKLQLSPEYVTVCALSTLLQKPVKWIETRSENLAAFAHAREQIHDVEAAFSSTGRLIAIKDRALMDTGAYLDSRISGQAVCALYELQGPYKVEAVDGEISIVLTNKCPYGAYRGFGLEIGVMIIERLLNIAARKLGIDQVDIRRRNLIKKTEMPCRTALGLVYDYTDYMESLEKALVLSNYAKLLYDMQTLRGEKRIVGIGLSVAVEPSSTNAYTGVVKPSQITASVDFGGASLKMDSDGSVKVMLGTVSLGTNHFEAVSKIVSEQLGVRMEDIQTIEGDTESTPYDCGVRASRFSTVVLPAVLESAQVMRAKLIKVAASLLEANENDIEVKDRKFFVRGMPNIYLRMEDVANVFYANTEKLPDGLEPALEVKRFFKPKKVGLFNAFSHAIHIAIVEVERDTGNCKIMKYFIVEDCGNIIVREVVDGQITGGLVQVIGGIFLEEMKYDENGSLLTTTFADYLLPSSLIAPDISIDHSSSPSQMPGGAKGMAESSNVAGYAAILNAIDDALAPYGIEVNYSHLPPERIWKLLNTDSKTHQVTPK